MEKADSFDRKAGEYNSYLNDALLFAEYQFGDKVPGESLRSKKDVFLFQNDSLLSFSLTAITAVILSLSLLITIFVAHF
jgi:hypothetical protein